jgi:hypothetical protein
MPACTAAETCCGTACVNLSSDTHNCGACAHDCMGMMCTAGLCMPSVVESGQTPNSIAVGGGYVYWTNAGTAAQNYSDGGVMKCATSPLGSPTPFMTSVVNAQGVALNATSVYWTSWGSGMNTGEVAWCPLGGCTSTPTPIATNQNKPSAIVLAVGHVFWSTNTGSRAVLRLPLPGSGMPTTYAYTANQTAFDVQSLKLFWFQVGGLATCPSGAASCIATTLETVSMPVTLTADATYVYWVEVQSGVGYLKRCSQSSCADIVTFESKMNGLKSANIVVDAAHIYIAEPQQITRCPIDPPCTEPLVLATFTPLAAPPAIAYDNSFLYYTQPTSVLRVAK